MPPVNERASVVAAIEKLLSNGGWTPDAEAQLPEQVGWVPDRILTRANGHRIALEVEEEVNIPRFLVRILESHRDLLESSRILVAAIRNTPLTIPTARVGIENGISIYSDSTTPLLVLDSSFPAAMTSVSQEVIDAACERFESNKRIPTILTQELSAVNHLAYARSLRQFAHDYESVSFNSPEAEHQFVHDFIMDHFEGLLEGSNLFEGLNASSLLEEVSEAILGKRPYFLHSFQVFLLGAIIIDKNYDLLTTLYSAGFETKESVPIDLPWFFTSLFHDVASGFEKIESISPVSQLREVRPRGISSLYSPHLLSCLFELLKSGAIDLEWEPQAESDPGGLYALLARYRWNEHGVMGAIGLMSSAQQMNRSALATIIYRSALAIALHNSRLWPELLESKLFPVSAKRFPLAFLLFLCDNIEEWGREKQFARTTGRRLKTTITELGFDQHLVSVNLWVDTPARAAVIKNRFDWITKRLFDTEDLEVRCTFSKSSGEG